MFRISSKSEVLFGEGASHQTGKRTVALGCSKVLCVYDPGVKNAGIVDPIIDNMEKAGLKVVQFGSVLPDPPDTMVDECGAMARAEKVDGVVGIGGGSSMDTAKAVNLLLTNPGPIRHYYAPGGVHVPGKPMVLVPTTAGTGSEVTCIAVVSNTATKTKGGIVGPAAIANLAIVDPCLMLGLPPQITAATGMDTFAHAIEAYTSAGQSLMSDMLSEKAIELVYKYLPKAMKNGADIEARTQLSFACLIAGMSFNDAMIHFGHAFGHTLGAMHHIPHGVACAVAMPGVIDVVIKVAPEKVRRVGELMGLKLDKDLSPEALGATVSDRIIAFNKEVGIPTLRELKVTEADLLPMAQAATRDVGFFFLPRSMSADEVLAIMCKAYAL
ncbi:MAG: iron-containing alcohol dehydrogenase [Pseudomonadota bacterium]